MNQKLKPIDFPTARERDYTSWQRAKNTDTRELHRISWLGWRIGFIDSPRRHRVRLAYDNERDVWIGDCTCDHMRYGDPDAPRSPCAHLCCVRQLDDHGATTVARAQPDHGKCPTCGEPRGDYL